MPRYTDDSSQKLIRWRAREFVQDTSQKNSGGLADMHQDKKDVLPVRFL